MIDGHQTALSEAARCTEWPIIQAQLKSDPGLAVHALRTLAQDGDRRAQFLLGLLLVNGAGVLRDPGAALHWFVRAARAEEPMAMNMLGRCHEYGMGTAVDHEKAAQWYWRAATYDCDWAMYNYAHMLANGRGVKQDRAAAFFMVSTRRLTRTCTRNEFPRPVLRERLGKPPIDCETAADWYRRSARAATIAASAVTPRYWRRKTR